jgi:hypothetical protein
MYFLIFMFVPPWNCFGAANLPSPNVAVHHASGMIHGLDVVHVAEKQMPFGKIGPGSG